IDLAPEHAIASVNRRCALAPELAGRRELLPGAVALARRVHLRCRGEPPADALDVGESVHDGRPVDLRRGAVRRGFARAATARQARQRGEDERRPRSHPRSARGITAASEVYATGERDGARQQLATARELWRERAAAVHRGDRVLGREVDVAFERVDEQMRAAATFDAVRDRLAPLNGQLLDGVREEVAPKSARLDPAVQAGVLAKVLDLLDTEYGRGGIAELRHAYGLVVRSQAVAREFAGDLGPRRADVVDALRSLRSRAFPQGAALPASPVPSSEVAERVAGVREALRDRFEIPGD
ncbi:MAG TPA: hypothetical protein VNT32_03065, partial [Thermoleophilaceae bacterium]|nr:hypothetical protein [Thermoleophilaceae bacterium]